MDNLDEAIREARQERYGNENQTSQLPVQDSQRQNRESRNQQDYQTDMEQRKAELVESSSDDVTNFEKPTDFITCPLCSVFHRRDSACPNYLDYFSGSKPIESRLTAESQKQLWWVANDLQLEPIYAVGPYEVIGEYFYNRAAHHSYHQSEVFDSIKDAISAARKLRITEMDRLQKEVNALDDRYDAIEDAEMLEQKVK